MNMHVKPSKLKVGDRVVEDKSVGGSDLVEHWNEYWKSAGPFEGAFYVTGLLHSGDEVSYSNKPGGNGPICPARYLKPAPLFAVGDRVRVARHCNYKGQNIPMGVPVGEVRKISRKTAQLAKEGIDTFSLDGDDRYFYTPLNLESAPTYTSCAAAEVDNLAAEYGGGKASEAKPKFKVGDRVKTDGGFTFDPNEGTVTRTNINGDANAFHVDVDGEDDDDWFYYESELEHVAVAPATATLQIEAGRYYKTRDGRKVGPMEAWKAGRDFQWESGGYLWTDDGENYDGRDSCHTIIAEWPVVATQQPPTAIADIVAKHSQTGTAIVCLLENGKPAPATRPFVHGNSDYAAKEAKRLAGIHKGQEFGVYTLGSVAKVERTYDHEWQRLAAKPLVPWGEDPAVKALVKQSGLSESAARTAVSTFRREAA